MAWGIPNFKYVVYRFLGCGGGEGAERTIARTFRSCGDICMNVKSFGSEMWIPS